MGRDATGTSRVRIVGMNGFARSRPPIQVAGSYLVRWVVQTNGPYKSTEARYVSENFARQKNSVGIQPQLDAVKSSRSIGKMSEKGTSLSSAESFPGNGSLVDATQRTTPRSSSEITQNDQ